MAENPVDGGGGAGPTWSIRLVDWPETLPARDAMLDLTIEVLHDQWPDPVPTDDWRLRMTIVNGTIGAPADVDWYRKYELRMEQNATVHHPSTLVVGDLHGERVEFRLTATHFLDEGRWTAREYQVAYEQDADAYQLLWAKDIAQCGQGWLNMTCPWSGMRAEDSPPPPPDW